MEERDRATPAATPGSAGAPSAVVNPDRPPPRTRFLIIGLVLAALLGVGLFTSLGSNSTAGRPTPGQAAPAFALPRLGGGTAVGVPADGGGNGHPAVVLFYASDCVPCRTEIPQLAAVYRHQPTHPVALIGVAAADPNPRAFATASGVTFPVGLDSSLNVTEGSYYFTGLPEAVFVQGDGKIAHIHYGALSPSELAQGERQYFGV